MVNRRGDKKAPKGEEYDGPSGVARESQWLTQEDLVEGRDRPHLTLDLSGVTMLTSIALAKLVALNGKTRAAGGRLTLSDPTPPVRQVFRVTRLDTVLEVASARAAVPA